MGRYDIKATTLDGQEVEFNDYEIIGIDKAEFKDKTGKVYFKMNLQNKTLEVVDSQEV